MIATDFLWLTLCIYNEARSEPLLGQEAVAHVILNRAKWKKYRYKSLQEIILDPLQFSAFNNGRRPVIREYEALLTAGRMAQLAIEKQNEGDDFQGADHYHRIDVDPTWDDEMFLVGIVGKHAFYRSSSYGTNGR